MPKKLLLAIDGSEASMKAVEHVNEVLSGHRAFEITLYHVCAAPAGLLEQGGSEDPLKESQLDERLHQQLAMWVERCRQKIEVGVFARAKEILADAISEGVSVGAEVDTEAHPDTATSIIRKAKEEGYRVVVLGRRGKSTLKEYVFGSVSSKVVHNIRDCAVWIVE